MAENRRGFIKHMAAMGFVYPTTLLGLDNFSIETPITIDELEQLTTDDDKFWKSVQMSYVQNNSFINLENGYFSPQPLPVLNAFVEYSKMINASPSYYMRTQQLDDKEKVRQTLAEFAETDAEEIALTRNTTESLNIVIQGFPMKKGDEAIITNQDYGSMVEAFKHRANTDGIVVKTIALPLQPKSDDEIVKVYENAITSKTKILLVTHLINTTGHLLPVKKICEMAHSKGIEVMVDGAHTFAHIDFKIKDLGCDYYAASLHKWLCAPLGAGLLWVKKNKIEQLNPLLGDVKQPKDNIRKLEHIGTHPCAVQLSIPEAIRFHKTIGNKRKRERLLYLKNYWVNKVKDLKNVSFNTPSEDNRTAAIANIAIKGMKPSELAKRLYDDYKIFTVAIETEAVNGVRVTPHLYTTHKHLDKMVSAITAISKA
jgi:selenocysteine lyase/cysteine desulfurase